MGQSRRDTPDREQVLVFGRFSLNMVTLELNRGPDPVPLRPQAATLLALLVERRGLLVTRDEIRERIWGDRFVEYDQGLNACIRQIRIALADNAEEPTFVETLPRQGYRFIHDVAVGDPRAAPNFLSQDQSRPPTLAARRQWAWAAVAVLATVAGLLGVSWFLAREEGVKGSQPAEVLPRLVVVPFDNLSADPQLEFLGAGLQEELITEIARLAPDHVQVLAPASATRIAKSNESGSGSYNLASEVGAKYLVSGSVRRSSTRVRVSARLVQLPGGVALWGQSFEGPLDDELAIQTRVARGVLGELLGANRPREPASSLAPATPRARDAYLKGRYLLQQPDASSLPLGVSFLERAAAEDGEYAPTWASLAEARFRLGDIESARRAADRALALDDDLPSALVALANIELTGNWSWRASEHYHRRAIDLAPWESRYRHSYAFLLAALGRHDEALDQMRLVLDLDPVSGFVNSDLGWFYYWAGRYDDAVKQCESTLEMFPELPWAHECLMDVRMAQGDPAEALARGMDLLGARGIEGASPEQFWEQWIASLVARQAEAGEPLLALAKAYAHTGQVDASLAVVQSAIARRTWWTVLLDTEPAFAALESDGRFGDLKERVGIWGKSSTPTPRKASRMGARQS